MRHVRTLAFRTHPERVAGALLMALGLSTVLGWLLRCPAWFELLPGLLPMVFNTGACFFLCGVAFGLTGVGGVGTRRVRGGLCGVVAALAIVTLIEVSLDRDLGVDLPSLHTWYDYGNVRPGRMAPNTALAFWLIAAGLALADRVRTRQGAVATMAVTFTVLTIGLVGGVGYLMSPDLLFGWARSARMALHTAGGVIVASMGLWCTWTRRDWWTSERYFYQGDKIRLLSAAVLVVVTITAGLSGFVLLQRSFEASLETRLAAAAQVRGPWLRAVVEGLSGSSRSAIEAAGIGGSTPRPRDLERAAQTLLGAGYRSVVYRNPQGRVLAQYGAVSEPAVFVAPLDPAASAALVWRGELRLRTHHVLASAPAGAMTVAAVDLESDASRLAPLLFGVGALGATAEVTACQSQGDMLVCLPNALNSAPFTVAMKRDAKHPLPMQLALLGGRPGIVHGLDYRGHTVIAAYTALAPGLGFVAKQDAVEAYAPIRAALAVGAPVIALLAIAGAVAMVAQLNPLVRRMRQSERDTAAALAKNLAVREAVSDGILTLSADGRIETSNAAANSMLGYAAGHLDGSNFFCLLAERVRARQREDFEAAIKQGDRMLGPTCEREIEGVRHDGSEFPLELTLNPVTGAQTTLFVAVMRDITARKMAEDVLSRMARFDALTGLPNRALFHDRLRTALARALRSGQPLGVMFLDLDGFKSINDRYGHSAGDELLKQVAARLTEAVRKTDTVARLAGDEFTIVLEGLNAGAQDAELVADKAVCAMRDAFHVDGIDMRVTVSVGIAVHDPRTEPPVELAQLLARADRAMYEVKRTGKNGFSRKTDFTAAEAERAGGLTAA